MEKFNAAHSAIATRRGVVNINRPLQPAQDIDQPRGGATACLTAFTARERSRLSGATIVPIRDLDARGSPRPRGGGDNGARVGFPGAAAGADGRHRADPRDARRDPDCDAARWPLDAGADRTDRETDAAAR